MRKLFLFPLFFCLPVVSGSWGFFGHQWINSIAVYTLPPQMFGFFKANMGAIVSNAVKPDMRRYAVAEEGARHFIDIDYYEKSLPLDTIRCIWREAVDRFGEETLSEHGIGPWFVVRMKNSLTTAFSDRNEELIIKFASELGHYIADLHVPLHTTSNYNGQKTGQYGIHGLWESRLPELFLEGYDLFVDPAFYITDIDKFIWDQVEISHSLVDSVLKVEKEAETIAGKDNKYSFSKRGQKVVRNYSEEYAEIYNRNLNNMVERRFRNAINAVGSVWFTAWVDAGQPELDQNGSSDNYNDELMIFNDSAYIGKPMIGRQE